jgi:hypothetical protein
LPQPLSPGDPTGKTFERVVAELYRAAGADEVRRDVLPVGSQVDVLVLERTPSGSVIQTVVECKSGRSVVGTTAVNEFSVRMQNIRRTGTYLATMVSEIGYTRQARDAAGKLDIELLEVADL